MVQVQGKPGSGACRKIGDKIQHAGLPMGPPLLLSQHPYMPCVLPLPTCVTSSPPTAANVYLHFFYLCKNKKELKMYTSFSYIRKSSQGVCLFGWFAEEKKICLITFAALVGFLVPNQMYGSS